MNIFSIQKFSQNIPNFDTLERVWQILFKVYNQTLRQMGDNDFSVEYTGVRVRQMAGTLERVVKYDAVAFQKTWDFLASSDDEEYYLFYFIFRRINFPGKGAKYGLFGGDWCFCSRWPKQGNELRKINKKFRLKQRQRFRKIHRRGHRTRASDTGRGSYKHNAPDLWNRGSIILMLCLFRFFYSAAVSWVFEF